MQHILNQNFFFISVLFGSLNSFKGGKNINVLKISEGFIEDIIIEDTFKTFYKFNSDQWKWSLFFDASSKKALISL